MTVENHNVINGLGSAVAEVVGEHCPVPMKRIGVQEVKVNPQQLDVSEFLDARMNCPTLNPPTHSWS